MISGLPKRLHMSRINSELSRKQVAELIGVSESTIGLYESGNRNPSLSSIVKLASIYKVTTDYLLGCDTNEVNQLSLVGLSSDEIKALTLTAKCFRQQNKRDTV